MLHGELHRPTKFSVVQCLANYHRYTAFNFDIDIDTIIFAIAM